MAAPRTLTPEDTILALRYARERLHLNLPEEPEAASAWLVKTLPANDWRRLKVWIRHARHWNRQTQAGPAKLTVVTDADLEAECRLRGFMGTNSTTEHRHLVCAIAILRSAVSDLKWPNKAPTKADLARRLGEQTRVLV